MLTNRPLACLLLGALAWGGASAQLAPSGFTSALNTPSADVLPTGSLGLGVANNNPEFARRWPGVGYSGSTVLGFGALPGLELTSRLAYDGDPDCNLYDSSCRSSMRDVSINAKYQLPVKLPLDTRLAWGFTDVGGAATQFRQTYGVMSSRWNYLEWSLGYGKPTSSLALLNGGFYSATLHLTERLRLSVEDDQRQRRYGASFVQPLGRGVDLQATLSRKFAGPVDLQTHQLTVGVRWALGHQAQAQGATFSGAAAPFEHPAQVLQQAVRYEAQLQTPPPLVSETVAAAPRGVNTPALLKAFADNGFRNISLGLTDDNTQWVQAEPVGWRQSRAEALGAALASWLQTQGEPHDRLWLTLTYLRQPVISLQTTRECAERFKEGADDCAGQASLRLQSGWDKPTPVQWLAQNAHSDWLNPRVELGLALRYNLGTEYGLTDHSAGLDTAWELPLARGLLWQGNATAPLNNSDDYGQPGGYWYANRLQRQVQTNLLSYHHPVFKGSWLQLSQGHISPTDVGQQANANWLSPMGRWRITGIVGHYETRQPNQSAVTHRPQLGSLRYSVLPGFWALDVTRGQFYNGDRGTRLMSHHWFGDHRLTFYFRDTQSADQVTLPRTKFAGFEITFPLGPRQAGFVGPFSFRGRDQMGLSLETKVGAEDNYITPGYGAVPTLRHGMNDVMDHDRTGIADLWANRYRIRAVLRTVAAADSLK